jgi:hypothetical protein
VVEEGTMTITTVAMAGMAGTAVAMKTDQW